MHTTTDSTYCVIGAGAAGLTAIKNLKEAGIPVVAFEREDDIGGNWYYGKPCSSIYRSVHTITSKRFTEYPDYRLPEEFPTYINHKQALEYLRSYARHFELYPLIEFNRSVSRVEPMPGTAKWSVTLSTGETRIFAGVVVANGHLWDPHIPQLPGHFDGITLHSGRYKTPEVFAGKNVLVVGAGNSGCDIAVEAAQHAARTFHSTRRGYFYWPKFLFGMPSDEWAEIPLRLRMPVTLRRLFGKPILSMFTAGKPAQYGLPEPDHKLFEAHYIINSTLLYHLAHGDIIPKKDIAELKGNRVRFVDGSEEPIDVIVYATGFNVKIPFLDPALVFGKDERPDLYLNIFPRTCDNLFLVGLFQTSTGNWPLFHYQSRLVASFLKSKAECAPNVSWLEHRKLTERPAINGGITFVNSSRHSLECEHFAYRSLLRKHIRKLTSPSLMSKLSRIAVIQNRKATRLECVRE
jgi:hypothetical protein